jgi:hypothetical protein
MTWETGGFCILIFIPLYIALLGHVKTIRTKSREVKEWQDRYVVLLGSYKELEARINLSPIAPPEPVEDDFVEPEHEGVPDWLMANSE